MLKQNKIALFFDCENISVQHLEKIYESLSDYGEVIVARAYADWSDAISRSWHDRLSEFAIEPIHVQPNTAYKNAADMKLVIDVMKTICTSSVQTIVIVSSDSDFTSLAIEVKANGFEVIGVGETKTPPTLRNAYSTFIQLPSRVLHDNSDEVTKEIKKFIQRNQDGFMNVSQLGIFLNHDPRFQSPKNYGVKTWGDFIKANADLFRLKSVGRRGSTLLVECVA